MVQTKYGFGATVGMPYEQVVSRVKELLQVGVLTEIDVKKTMKQKLDAEFRKYVTSAPATRPWHTAPSASRLEIGPLASVQRYRL